MKAFDYLQFISTEEVETGSDYIVEEVELDRWVPPSLLTHCNQIQKNLPPLLLNQYNHGQRYLPPLFLTRLSPSQWSLPPPSFLTHCDHS